MCYKQCEIWKCFKTRCLDNHRLMGYPDPSGDEAAAPDRVVMKTEPDDMEFVDHINVSESYNDMEHSNSYDPLGNSLKRRRKKSRKDVHVPKPMISIPGDTSWGNKAEDCSSDVDYSTSAKKMKRAMAKALAPKIPGQSVSGASQSLYMKTYRDFLAWKEAEGAADIDEDLMLRYFHEISKNLAASTLTNKLSHLVKTIQDFHNVKIDGYQRLRQFCRDVRQLSSTKLNVSGGAVQYIDE